MKPLLRRAWDFFLELLWPRRANCMGCGSMLGCDRDDLCEECRETLARRWLGVREVNPDLHLSGAAFAYPYAGPAGGLVRRLKYTGVGVLAERMSVELARAAKLMRVGDDVLVTCVPMHPKRLRSRGVNHAELLARGAAREMELEFGDVLMRTRNSPQQARLSDAERLRNLKGGFAVRPEWRERVKGAKILLIDDVFTTGSTARHCAGALLEAGAAKVYFAAYALGGGSKHGQNHQRKEPHGAAPAISEGRQGAQGDGPVSGGGRGHDPRGPGLRTEAH